MSVNLEYIAVTVTCRVQPTVMTTHVKHRMEHALHVNLDGLDYSVKQVVLLIVHVIMMYITCTCINNKTSVTLFCKHQSFDM